MPAYDFKTLSPLDFESLVRDLLQEELKITLESFKPGRDSGIDFRYAASVRNMLVVQAKHFVGSGFDKLISHLVKDELPKVKLLNPERYLIATSVPLSPLQKEKIVVAMDSTIKSPTDIFGCDDLNNLLGKFPRVEEQTFKLWFSSVAVLEKLLHSKLKNFSRGSLEGIREKSRVYVSNKSFQEAIELIKSQHYCVIAGVPGIGKTILAEMLGLYFAKQGFEFIRITTAKEAFEFDFEHSPRFLYYDDFLGQTSSADKLEKNEDQALIELIAEIRRSKVSILVLTTRGYILNQARQEYAKIDYLARTELKPYVVDLEKYTREIKAKILYNHLFFSTIDRKALQLIIKTSNLCKIIDHPNYSPRIIEHMTRAVPSCGLTAEEYLRSFLESLDNPTEIWRYAFERHINSASRNLLLSLFSLPSPSSVESLFRAFQSMTEGDARSFRESLKELDGTFVKIRVELGRTLVEFHNPSVRDFLNTYLAANVDLLRHVADCAAFWEQLDWLCRNRNNGELGKSIREHVIGADVGQFFERISKALKYPSASMMRIRYNKSDIKLKDWNVSLLRRVGVLIDVAVSYRIGSERFLSDIV